MDNAGPVRVSFSAVGGPIVNSQFSIVNFKLSMDNVGSVCGGFSVVDGPILNCQFQPELR
jgi:hypothetical protein